MKNRFASLVMVACACVPMSAVAQQVYTAKDYANAERWMAYNVNSLVFHTIPGAWGRSVRLFGHCLKAGATPNAALNIQRTRK